jgi:hypothetical protein
MSRGLGGERWGLDGASRAGGIDGRRVISASGGVFSIIRGVVSIVRGGSMGFRGAGVDCRSLG